MSLPEFLRDGIPLRKSAQRLRWFTEAFAHQLALVSNETGNTYKLDDVKLTQAFADWMTSFERQKPESDTRHEPFIGFAAGVMLRALVDAGPVRLVARPDQADVSKPPYFWPEGYLYVSFCLMLRALVLEEEFARAQQTSHEFESIKTWWSFRENVTEDSSTAIAFLDLFAGDEPNWMFPQIFRSNFH